MKVFFLSHDDKLYGANRSLITLVEGLHELGVESAVAVPSLDGELAEHLRSLSVQLFEFEPQSWCLVLQGRLARLSFPLKFAVEIWRRQQRWRQTKKQKNTLLKLLGKFNPDVIYTNSAVTPSGYRLARKLSVPHVWHLREYGDLDYNLYLMLGKKISSLVIAKSKRVICNSESVKKHYFPESTTRRHVSVVPNGVYTSKEIDRIYHEHRAARVGCNEFVFVLVGLVRPKKQQITAIRAFIKARQSVKSIRLRIVGGGDKRYINQLTRMVSDHGIAQDVIFCGYLADATDELINADCALMCSAYEAFGRVTAEAMAAGLPVIGNDSGSTPEIVEDGVDGLLYDGSVDQLAQCMVDMASNPSRASAMGEVGHQKAKTTFNAESYSKRVFDLLSDVAES